LAFLAICIRLDILAYEYYFNTVFAKEPDIVPLLDKFEKFHGTIDPTGVQEHWNGIMEKYEKYLSGKNKMSYMKLIEDLSDEKENAATIYSFRCSMTHVYTPGNLTIDHKEPKEDVKGLLHKQGNDTVLYLRRFKDFHESMQKKMMILSIRIFPWYDMGPRLRTTDLLEPNSRNEGDEGWNLGTK
jgi:hypothetical protein